MTLIFPDTRGDEPSTHALIIGVGGYRHLVGGVDQRNGAIQQVGEFGQLTSPPRSAIAFAQYLLGARDSLRAPLGSIELLISPAPNAPDPFPNGLQADPATREAVQAAYDAWRERCNRASGNTAIFYFCGHGVQKADQYLLLEDFGAIRNNAWLGSFAFESTRLAFQACRAETQCFFIDACRKVTPNVLVAIPTGIPLENPSEDISASRFDLTMRAAARNTLAFGPKGKPSYYTQALIKALKGHAGTQGAGGWVVTSGQIAKEINRIMGLIKASEASKQRCECTIIDNTELVTLDSIPCVPLSLACTPEAANAEVGFACRRLSMPPQDPILHKGGPWSRDVNAGTYFAEARFAAGTFGAAQREFMVIPPAHNCLLECQ